MNIQEALIVAGIYFGLHILGFFIGFIVFKIQKRKLTKEDREKYITGVNQNGWGGFE